MRKYPQIQPTSEIFVSPYPKSIHYPLKYFASIHMSLKTLPGPRYLKSL